MNKKKNEKILLSSLVEMEKPESVLSEVKIIISTIIPEFDFRPLYRVFYDIVKLFSGEYPGYRKCNTEYHDLKHTTDTLLTITRLIHGYFINNEPLCEKDVFLGLVSALMHDTGYIQTLDEKLGTGAKYTLEHVIRSVLFTEKYFVQNNYLMKDFKFCKNCINVTDTDEKNNDINFSSYEEDLVGKMLGTADLLSQMADRIYLEKLLFLYYEFKEGCVLGYESELDLLKKTLKYYTSTREKFESKLGNMNKYMIYHFKERWNIDKDLYMESIEKNIEYLQYILENHEKDYRDYLKRGNIVKKLQITGFIK